MSDTKEMTELEIRCVLEAEDGTRTEYTIRTDNRDRIAFELVSRKRNWPSMDEATFLFLTFAAFAALKRSGVKPYPDFDKFSDRCVIVEPITQDDGTADVPVDPTELDLDSDSA